ncbi:hypothetical protein Jann_2866 [Jannaschia sp. CCS1]|nr:hypothetical protein Jann_2866 [Jannaschia sp. CCS1]
MPLAASGESWISKDWSLGKGVGCDHLGKIDWLTVGMVLWRNLRRLIGRPLFFVLQVFCMETIGVVFDRGAAGGVEGGELFLKAAGHRLGPFRC